MKIESNSDFFFCRGIDRSAFALTIIEDANQVCIEFWESRGGVLESVRQSCNEWRMMQLVCIGVLCFIVGVVY